MQSQKPDKFIRFAEVLPNNANTAKIVKEREEIALAKAEKDKAVSILKTTQQWLMTLFKYS